MRRRPLLTFQWGDVPLRVGRVRADIRFYGITIGRWGIGLLRQVKQ